MYGLGSERKRWIQIGKVDSERWKYILIHSNRFGKIDIDSDRMKLIKIDYKLNWLI